MSSEPPTICLTAPLWRSIQGLNKLGIASLLDCDCTASSCFESKNLRPRLFNFHLDRFRSLSLGCRKSTVTTRVSSLCLSLRIRLSSPSRSRACDVNPRPHLDASLKLLDSAHLASTSTMATEADETSTVSRQSAPV